MSQELIRFDIEGKEATPRRPNGGGKTNGEHAGHSSGCATHDEPMEGGDDDPRSDVADADDPHQGSRAHEDLRASSDHPGTKRYHPGRAKYGFTSG